MYETGMLSDVYAEWDAYLADPKQYETQTRALAAEWTLSDPFWMACDVCVSSGKVRIHQEVLGNEGVIKGPSDVLMGLSTVNEAVCVEVWVENSLVNTLSLNPGRPELILTNNIIPLVALVYHEIQLKMSLQCRVVAQYAALPEELRRCLAKGNWRTETMYIACGMSGLAAPPGFTFTRLPDWIPVWRRMLEMKRRQLDVYGEELVMQACRPERLWQIGID